MRLKTRTNCPKEDVACPNHAPCTGRSIHDSHGRDCIPSNTATTDRAEVDIPDLVKRLLRRGQTLRVHVGDIGYEGEGPGRLTKVRVAHRYPSAARNFCIESCASFLCAVMTPSVSRYLSHQVSNADTIRPLR